MRMRPITYKYIAICGMSGPAVFFHIISQKARFLGNKSVTQHKMCFDFLCNFYLKHFCNKKNLARYNHKCKLVFM
jgi:hypothetical protein